MFILTHKLKLLKVALKSWNNDSFGNIHDSIDRAKKELSSIQLLIDQNRPSVDLVLQERRAQDNLQKCLPMEEEFWKEKARVKWFSQGTTIHSSFIRW